METMVTIKNLKHSTLFDHLEFTIKKGTFLCLVGKNSCGKSTLIRMIAGLYPHDGEITIDGILLNSQTKTEIQKKIGVVFENPDTNFIGETPREDILFLLRNRGYDDEEIEKKIKETSKYFKIEDLMDVSLMHLSGGQKQLIALAVVCSVEPDLILLDDAFAMIDGITKDKILKLLKKQNRDKKTTILYTTHDMDDTLYGKEIALIHQKKIVLCGKKEKVLMEEKLFREAGIELPFMASLSLKLQFYGLIDKMILDMDKMVDVLWK